MNVSLATWCLDNIEQYISICVAGEENIKKYRMQLAS